MGSTHTTKKEIMSEADANKAIADGESFFSPGYQEPMCGGSCFDDKVGLIVSFFCCCIVNASNRGNLDGRPVEWNDYFCPANPYQTRQSLRQKYALEYHKLNDCLASWLCQCCVANQEAREIASRLGKDPKFIGSYE